MPPRIPARASALVGLLLLLWPVVAHAQGTAEDVDEIRRNARVHVGPFYLSPTFQVKELGVDTNVFNEAGEQKKDFVFNLSPGAELWVPVARRALLATTTSVDLVWFRKYASERSVDPRLSARGELYFNRLTLFGESASVNTRQRPSFEIDVRSRHIVHDLSAGVGYRLTSKFSLEVAGRRGTVDYDVDDSAFGGSFRETLNRTLAGVTLVARHKATALTTFALRTERFTEEFEFSPHRDATSVRVMPGVEFKPRALINGTAYVGFRRFRPKDRTALPEYTGLVAQLGLSHTILGATSIGVSFNRDVNYSFERTLPYYLDHSVGASVRRALGPRFDVLVSADRHRYAYRNLVAATAPDERTDTTWNYAGSVGYRPGRSTRIGFGVSYWQRDSTTAHFRDYDGLRIGTSVTYGF